MPDFEAAHAAWSGAPFPSGSERDDLSDLHGDLAVADEWILSTVYPFAEHGTITPARIDISAGLKQLRDRIVDLRKTVSGDDAILADSYLDYLGLLEAVYREFISASAVQ